MEPKEALRTFVEQALTGLPEGEDRERTREELIADLTDCYEGALSEGLAPEAAYDRAVESLGDLNELCDGPRHDPGEPPPPPPGPRHGPGEPPPPPPSPRHGPGEPPPPPPGPRHGLGEPPPPPPSPRHGLGEPPSARP